MRVHTKNLLEMKVLTSEIDEVTIAAMEEVLIKEFDLAEDSVVIFGHP